ncbi:MAG: AAA family ATPase [Xanthobacteraceae bacterium]
MSLLRDDRAEALGEAYLDFNDSDLRADVPPVESAEEFGIGPDEPHSSDAAPAIKNLPVAYPLQAFANIKLDATHRNYLVKGLIAGAELAVIWGPPKCGKSFWAADLGLHIALGWDYRGHKVQQAPVVYVALEGRHGFPARIKAFRRHHGLRRSFYSPPPSTWSQNPDSLSLRSKLNSERLFRESFSWTLSTAASSAPRAKMRTWPGFWRRLKEWRKN